MYWVFATMNLVLPVSRIETRYRQMASSSLCPSHRAQAGDSYRVTSQELVKLLN